MNHPNLVINHPSFCSMKSPGRRFPSLFMAARRSLVYGGAVLLMVQTLSAATLTFSSNADYDNNFYEAYHGAGSEVTRPTVPTVYDYLQKTGSTASAIVYNTTATGGSGGAGGTGAGPTLDRFSNFTLQVDYSPLYLGASNNLGIYTKVNDAGMGYMAIFSLTNATTANFRLFESNATFANAGAGTEVTNVSFTRASGSFLANNFYTFKFTVTDVGSNVNFDASVWNVGGGSIIGTFATLTDTSSAVTGVGQVGFRLGSDGKLDNFSITSAIPEPGTSVIFASGAALLLAGWVRRKRSSC